MRDFSRGNNPKSTSNVLILHKSRPSVNIKDVLKQQVGFNYLLSHKGIVLLMLPLTWLTSTVPFDVATSILYGLMHILTFKPLRCINTLLGVC